jgi:hypothetical protein
MPFLLKFTPLPAASGMGQYHPPTAAAYYLTNLGGPWPRNPEKRLIERTSADRSEAKEFDTEEDARACLVSCGEPKGWEAVSA